MAFTQDVSVRSEPLVNGKAVARPPRKGGTWALALALIAFGAIGWIFGGMFTFDGWITWVNGAFSIVRLPVIIPPASGWWRFLFVPLAIAYSRVEVKHRPVWRDKAGKIHIEAPSFWAGFILITLTDIGSTAVGIQHTDPAQWGALEPLVLWTLRSGLSVGAVSTILTFAPEWLILSGVWLLRR